MIELIKTKDAGPATTSVDLSFRLPGEFDPDMISEILNFLRDPKHLSDPNKPTETEQKLGCAKCSFYNPGIKKDRSPAYPRLHYTDIAENLIYMSCSGRITSEHKDKLPCTEVESITY